MSARDRDAAPVTDPREVFSFGRMATRALGAAGLVLLLSVPAIVVLGKHSPGGALAVAVLAVVLTVAVIALVARREMRPMQQALDEARARAKAKAEAGAKTDGTNTVGND
ncbi:MAG: hypothetical protein QM774_05490 [Gordonia sp. (in: high G+C Gram-positive bacteria)]|uniref:hypothetical protein n=1 Tax=Gordonia sp. (in: high G+C Gram-positive bacteria) TaxID=84139 RepID=UPI0039E2C7E9